MQKIVYILLFSLCFSGQQILAQLPDSIYIEDLSIHYMDGNVYKYILKKGARNYTLYRKASETFVRGFKTDSNYKLVKITTVPTEWVSKFSEALNESYPSMVLENFSIDSEYVKKNQDSIFEFVKDKKQAWTETEKAAAKQCLSNWASYTRAWRSTMFQDWSGITHGGYYFKTTIYFPNNKIRQLDASKNYLTYPWRLDRKANYNPAFPKLFRQILPVMEGSSKERFDDLDNLLMYFARRVFEDNCISL